MLRAAALAGLLTIPPAWGDEPAGVPDLHRVELFSRPGCPHCAEAKAWLEALDAQRTDVDVVVHDVAADAEARARLYVVADAAGISPVGVPAIVIGDVVLVGFSSDGTSAARVRDALAAAHVETGGATDDVCSPVDPCLDAPASAVDLPWFGRIDVAQVGLPLFTVALGLIDGFNPCATWVLVFVLSLLVNLKDRARMLLIGGTFVVVSGLVYYAFMAAWLSLFWLLGASRIVQVGLGLVALFVGGVNIKDFFAFKQGLTLSIPDSAKAGIGARAKAVLRAENLPAALIAAASLAVMVNAVELLCTAGLPAVYTQVLTAQGVSPAARYAWLALYNVAYMLDDAALLTLAVVTLSKRRLEEKGGRQLKLVSGLVMTALALMLLFAPDWLVW